MNFGKGPGAKALKKMAEAHREKIKKQNEEDKAAGVKPTVRNPPPERTRYTRAEMDQMRDEQNAKAEAAKKERIEEARLRREELEIIRLKDKRLAEEAALAAKDIEEVSAEDVGNLEDEIDI